METKILNKINRKLKHCEEILFKHENVKFALEPTNSLFVGNGGLGCGISENHLVKIFKPYGFLKNVVLPIGKPYAFIVYADVESAMKAKNCILGKRIDSSDLLYISYILESDVPKITLSQPVWPEGLCLLKDFISADQEIELLKVVQFSNLDASKSVLKHRTVKHYGFEFIYGSNLIDISKPLEEKIPDVCIPHLKRLVDLGYLKRVPEQLTVNHYLPGQGIPPHIDTHSCFEDSIVSISLGSQVVMEFSHAENVIPVLVPQRSALIMKGESRYLFKHGITPRKTDVVTLENPVSDHLSILERSPRTSLTFRIIRSSRKCDCKYKEECDSHPKEKIFLGDLNSNDAEKLEKKHVNEVYEKIADHFSHTRYKPWPKVKDFLASIPQGSLVLDVGCGNGKNLKLTTGCFEIGCDASSNLATLCAKRGVETIVGDCLRLPFRSCCVDFVICIAVIHHLSTEVRRLEAIKEILRILQFKGLALVYVWAFEQNGPQGPSNYLKVSKQEVANKEIETSEILIENDEAPKCIEMTVHENRTDFIKQDILVPWKSASHTEHQTTHHRYYHVFVQGELDAIVTKCNAKVISSYYDKGNWCVIFEKS